MTQKQFLLRLAEEIQLNRALSADEMLCDIDEWDSLAMLGLLNLFDEMDLEIEMDELDECKSIQEILQKAGFGD